MDRLSRLLALRVLLCAACLAGPALLLAKEPSAFSALLPRSELRLPHSEVQKRLSRYVPADIGVPPGKADAQTQKLMKKLVEA